MKNICLLRYILVLTAGLFWVACKTQKETAVNRGMQNLTARYNILYNARLLLEESERNIEESYFDDFSNVLPLYRDPVMAEGGRSAEAANLDSAIRKGTTIANEKAQSSYVDDAYYVIGKANFLKANYYDAAEFFSYVIKNYPQEKELRLSSLAWKMRALMQLNYMEDASRTLDSALRYFDPSARAATEVYAAHAQLLIKEGKEREAIDVLKKAIEGASGKKKLRWTYILAQLQERTNQQQEAFINYGRVEKSNVSFEMSFNAGLNRIRMTGEDASAKSGRIAALRSMLKSDKYREFNDQIYYRIGDLFMERQQTDEAIASYNRATRQQGGRNPVSKGLSYLKLADIYFKTGNYQKAKTYYDTTLSTLPQTYPSYEQIRVKSTNLNLLADRYGIIAREDTLQALARMGESERNQRIGELVRQQADKRVAAEEATPGPFLAGIDSPGAGQQDGKFYFNNTAAVSQGFSDFKRRWGNRPLADDWRRGRKSASDVTEAGAAPVLAADGKSSSAPLTEEDRIREFTGKVPLTSEGLRSSNERKAAAYFDIAGFYRDDLKDKKEAIETLEDLLRAVPASTFTPAAYYNLYLLYGELDKAKSEGYKSRLLSEYPASTYAKVASNPRYNRDEDERQTALNNAYKQVYDLYLARKYQEVIAEASRIENVAGSNSLSPQFAYLKALATGHTQKLPPFEQALKAIADSFSTDQLITPLVRQHLEYVGRNRNDFASRPTALLDYNPDNIFMEPEPSPLIAQVPVPLPVQPEKQAEPAPANVTASRPEKTEEAKKPASGDNKKEEPRKEEKAEPVIAVQQPKPAEEPQKQAPEKAEPVTVAQQPNRAEDPQKQAEAVAQPAGVGLAESKPSAVAARPGKTYAMPEAAEYYFAVNVSGAELDLSPSRFGIGQFNRSKFASSGIKHQLKSVNNENQLIFVGPFQSLTTARNYERSILPLMRDIMKVASERYNTFVVSKEQLDKFNSRTSIEEYAEFYKNYK